MSRPGELIGTAACLGLAIVCGFYLENLSNRTTADIHAVSSDAANHIAFIGQANLIGKPADPEDMAALEIDLAKLRGLNAPAAKTEIIRSFLDVSRALSGDPKEALAKQATAAIVALR